MSRLGIFGGSFDPVHYGHLLLAENAREQYRLDRVIFVPAGQPPHKQVPPLASAEDRAAMLQLAIAGHEAFEISRYELDQTGVCYTVQTLRYFRTQYPEAELFLILGGDMLKDLPHWREADEVIRLARPLAARRPGWEDWDWTPFQAIASPEQIEQIRSGLIQMPLAALSSTEIRRRVAAGRSIRYQTPRAVEQYILTHGLYRNSVVSSAASPREPDCSAPPRPNR
ncbi:MAG TPA: nicotinate-nucleotide adenylyltransferase [Thermoguttaceae bacterium]|nr:nicotinate-nucleotide adenylyltransferase [Thermoguttaceae bacterium]